MKLSEKELQEILEKGHAKIHTENTGKATDLELPSRDQPLEKKESQRFTSQVNIRIHSVRKRLCDPDGISAKAVIDGVVKAGILRDDSAEFVSEVRFTQEKAQGREEETIITIEET